MMSQKTLFLVILGLLVLAAGSLLLQHRQTERAPSSGNHPGSSAIGHGNAPIDANAGSPDTKGRP